MATQQQFLNLLNDIEPSPTTVEACSSAHRTLRNRLAKHDTFKRVHVDTFLSGSYARSTALRPRTINKKEQRPDVDIIVITNYSQTDDPADVVDTLYRAVKQCGYEFVTRNRRSVNVQLAAVEMDLVPIIDDPYSDGYLIPDTELASWLKTNPPATPLGAPT